MSIPLRQIAQALGGLVITRDTVLAPGPGHSPRDRSLSVRISPDAPDGFVVHSHSGDDWRACRDYVRSKLGMPPWEPGDEQNRRIQLQRVRAFDRAVMDAEAAERRPRTEDDLIRIARAVDVWSAAVDPRGTLAEMYLREHRQLDLPDALANTVLRFHPRCPWRDENTGKTIFVPALIAAFRSIDDDDITAIYRIALKPDGSKIDRRMLGIVQRAAVKLAPSSDVLHVGEGVETCMAAGQLGHTPAWAAGSAGLIAHFPVLDGVGCLRLLGERDNANARAVELCAQRWHGAGRRVQIGLPDDKRDKDFNDQLMREAS